MTDDRSLERAARSWIDEGPTRAPERAVERALQLIQTTPQERDLPILRRFQSMSMTARLAAVALVGVLAVGAIYALWRPGSSVAVPGPSSTPTPSPSISSAPAYSTAPNGTWGDWEAETDTALPGLTGVTGRIQLSINWDGGADAWVQTQAGDLVLGSNVLVGPADEIRFIATTRDVGCVLGDVGRYHWSRSADGLYLTLSAIEDGCAPRATAFGRTWVHALDAVNDGGLGVIPFSTRWIQATLPSIRFAMGGSTESPDIHTFDAGGPSITLLVIKDPVGFAKPCSTTTQATVAIPRTTAGFVSYVRGLPGFNATTANSAVDGRPAVHLTVTPKATSPCGSRDMAAFHSMNAPAQTLPGQGAEGEWDVGHGSRHSFWIVDVDADTYLFWYEGEGVTTQDEQAVISSVKFLDNLPKP